MTDQCLVTLTLNITGAIDEEEGCEIEGFDPTPYYELARERIIEEINLYLTFLQVDEIAVVDWEEGDLYPETVILNIEATA